VETTWFYELKIISVFLSFDEKFGLRTMPFTNRTVYFVLETNDSNDTLCVEYFKQENILSARNLLPSGLTKNKM